MRASPVSLWRHITRGVRGLLHEHDADRDLRDELSHYAEQLIQSKIASGMSPQDAQREVQREIGNTTNVRESVRGSLWESAVGSAIGDARYAMRTLRRNPVFTAVVVLVIAVGIGAVTTIVTAANAYLFKPLPGTANTAQLVQVDRVAPDGKEGAQASYPYLRYLADNNTTLSGVAGWSKVDLTISRGDGGKTAYGAIVTANYFSVLGVQPMLGRFFLPGEDAQPLAHPLVVVSYDFWSSQLGADSSIVGQTVQVNGRPYTLIGVAARNFVGVFTPIRTAAWVPLSMQPAVRPTRSLNETAHWLWTFARVRDGVTREQAHADLSALTKQYTAQSSEQKFAQAYTAVRLISLTGLPDDAHKLMSAFLAVLLAAAVAVLSIAGVNVAAMLSARAIARRHEIALRSALGAPRSRIVRHLMTETLVLFVAGGSLGLLLAIAATRALERIPLPTDEPLVISLPLDVRVVGFAVLLSMIAGLLFGILPALRAARKDLQTTLRSESAGSGRRRPVVSNVLVVGQLALSMVLLVTAGLLVRALQTGQRTNPGFVADGVAVTSLSSEAWGYDTERARAFFDRLRERIEALPGVQGMSYTGIIPVTMASSGTTVTPDNSSGPDDGRVVKINAVDADFFSVLQIPLVEGRLIGPEDNAKTRRVAVINETMAKKFWPGTSAVGHTMVNGTDTLSVVGVVRDAKYASLAESSVPFLYVAFQQQWRSDPSVLVRSSNSFEVVSREVARVVRELDPAIPPPKVMTLPNAMTMSLLPQRVAAMVAGAMGFVGMLLATVGLYGIVAYSVGQRSREIGIRMTLGAQRGDVRRGIIRDGMRLAAIGVLGGLLLAIGTSQLLEAYLYGVSPMDAMTYGTMSVLFVLVTLLANYVPARRASMSDPVRVLRGE
jgi:predicted permease